MARIELTAVEKTWGDVTAVHPIDMDFAKGGFTTILGPSGCGKSTTLLMLAGIYQPTSGDILFDGQRVNEVEARDRNVGIVFQSYALYPNMTVRQNIAFPLSFQKLSKAETDTRVTEMADLMQVRELLERKPGQLSGGQQQRVALARALVKRPDLLLLDEPLSNLDAALRLTMRAELRRLHRELGVTTILVTHDQIEATTMADTIIVMNKGRIEQSGTADDLYARPASRFVAGFVGTPPMNLLAGKAGEGIVAVGEARFALSNGTTGPVALGVRPEVARLGGAKTGEDIALPARVSAVEPMGREVLYTVETPAGPITVLEAGAVARWRENDEAALTFPAAATYLFDREGRRLAERLAPRS